MPDFRFKKTGGQNKKKEEFIEDIEKVRRRNDRSCFRAFFFFGSIATTPDKFRFETKEGLAGQKTIKIFYTTESLILAQDER